MSCAQCDLLREREGRSHLKGAPCDICNGTGYDYLGRACRHSHVDERPPASELTDIGRRQHEALNYFREALRDRALYHNSPELHALHREMAKVCIDEPGAKGEEIMYRLLIEFAITMAQGQGSLRKELERRFTFTPPRPIVFDGKIAEPSCPNCHDRLIGCLECRKP